MKDSDKAIIVLVIGSILEFLGFVSYGLGFLSGAAFWVLMTKNETDDSPPLSEIELNDIRLSEEEFASGEAPIFDSVDEMFDSIEKEDEE